MPTETTPNNADTLLRESLDAFLENEEANVLVLKGDWGVGKTYFWDRYINERIEDKGKPLSQIAYSYVSLFGVSSLDDIKQSVFQQSKAIESIEVVKQSLRSVPDENDLFYNRFPWVKEMFPAIEKVGRKRAHLGQVSKWSKYIPDFKPFAPLVSFVEYNMVNNFIVCIDDLERKGDKLSVREVMGLADELAVKKQCKVVLIFNKECLPDPKDTEAFENYREKVVDVELTYNPSYEENLQHIFDVGLPYYSLLLEVVKTLGIKNIRVLKKIKWAIDYFLSRLEGIQESIINGVIIHVVLFCWSFFNSKGALDLGFVKTRMNRASWAGYFSHEENRESDEEKKFRELVSVLHLEGAEYDKYIIGLLEHGFTDLEGFGGEIKTLSEQMKDQEIDTKLEQAWDIYAESFEDNLQDFLAAIKSQLDENLHRIKLKSFSDAINILSEFGEDVDAYITSYAETRKDYLETIDMQHVHWGRQIDAKLLSTVESLHADAKTHSIDEIALKIAQGGWNPEDIDYLHSLTVDDYFEWMMSSPDELVTKVRSGLLSFGRTSFSQDAEKYHKILRDVEEALRKIAALNELNKKRVSNLYGINLDEASESQG